VDPKLAVAVRRDELFLSVPPLSKPTPTKTNIGKIGTGKPLSSDSEARGRQSPPPLSCTIYKYEQYNYSEFE
jgi:hypothetical protein